MNCEGFKITNKFPNNICLLAGNRVMYVIDFEIESDIRDRLLDKYFLIGFLFECTESAFNVPSSSSRIGFFKASRLDVCEIHRVQSSELQSKCFIFPRGKYEGKPEPSVNPLPQSFAQVVRDYVSADAVERFPLLSAIRFEGVKHKTSDASFRFDYWWIHSLIVPGRFSSC